MFIVGIDWADQKHDVAVTKETGEKVLVLTISHDHQGMISLADHLQKLSPNKEDFACIVETNNGLLVHFLTEAGFPVYPLNPKIVDARRKPSGAKSDAVDALILADIGRADLPRLRRLHASSELLQELRVLTRDQDNLIDDSTRLTNQLIACLKEYYPVAVRLFSKMTSPVTLNFLKAFPSLQHARQLDVPSLAQFLKEHRHPKPNETAIAIHTKLQEKQLEASPAVTRAKVRLMLTILSQLEPLIENIKAYDKEIQKLFTQHSDSRIFVSLPRAGERLAPRMLAEWGDDRSRFESASVVQAMAGTSPVLYQSGKFCYARQRKSCIKSFRRLMHQFAFQSISQYGVPWARDYYDSKRKQGKKHHEAVRQLANVWVRIIYALWINGTPYNEQMFLEAKTRHQRAA